MLGASACDATRVTFTDHNLEAAIRYAIDKPEGYIHTSDLAGLTSLNASDRHITTLKGLEHCTSLTRLELDFNQIKDLSPLAPLTNLTILGLWSNQISDILPLVSLPNLSSLYIGDNPLNAESLDIYIPQFERRGVNVVFATEAKSASAGAAGGEGAIPGVVSFGVFAVFLTTTLILLRKGWITLTAWLVAFWVVSAFFCFTLSLFLAGVLAEDEVMILAVISFFPLLALFLALVVLGILVLWRSH